MALAIIAIIVVVIVIILFRSGGEKGFGFAENLISGLEKDTDGDGVKDSLDQCNGEPNSQTPQTVNEKGCIDNFVIA